MNFQNIYKNLNDAQKQAVDTIDGPVLVIAGPGTGKTQLLSARVANILKKTDTLPGNILCLTFSEAGARNMQSRLASMIGADAYKVAIHTFHGFAGNIMERFPDYFYNGARLTASDPLTQHQTLEAALSSLSHSNYFSARFENDFTHQAAARQALSDVKQAGLLPQDLRDIARDNEQFIGEIRDLVNEAFGPRMSAATYQSALNLLEVAQVIEARQSHVFIPALKDTFVQSLELALQEANQGEHEKVNTKPLTAFKKKWCEASSGGQVLKAKKQSEKLRDLADVYENYTAQMQTAKLYDFDDMIVQVVNAMENEADLRAEMQEQYLYVLVDEYQDTNLAQARLLHAWADNPVNEGSPNLMAVGDDDQAIYSFQGADVSNMLDYAAHYPSLTQVVLTSNYRSPQNVLDLARQVVVQGEDRLENRDRTLNKELKSYLETTAEVSTQTFNDNLQEYAWIAQHTKELLESGEKAEEIAIIARGHEKLRAIASQCYALDIHAVYEKRDNVLEQPIVVLILQIAAVVTLLQKQQFDLAESLLPKLFTHPAWKVPMGAVWQLSIKAHAKRPSALWLETLRQEKEAPNAQLELIASTDLDAHGLWLIALSQEAQHRSLETMLDYIIGSQMIKGHETSPLYEYYFSSEKLDGAAETYLETLRHLRALRDNVKQYQNSDHLWLRDFVKFTTDCLKTNTVIASSQAVDENAHAIQLMTAHGAKGREFKHVIIVDANHGGWSKAKHGGGNLTYPANASELTRGGNSEDDRLRLFYVALTRAKTSLTLTRSLFDEKNVETLGVSWLSGIDMTTELNRVVDSPESEKRIEVANWQQAMLETSKQAQAQELLQPELDRFKLSASALDCFLDLEHAGPTVFLERYLLRFPSAQSVHAAFGTAVHNTLQFAHLETKASKNPGIEQLLEKFEEELAAQHLLPEEYTFWSQRGKDILTSWLDQKLASFSSSQIAERALGSNILIGDARVTGKIDVLTPDGESMIVTDYKTGKPESTWSLEFPKSNAKLYTYKRQLTFYKMLVEASTIQNKKYTVATGVVSFIPPAKDNGELVDLHVDLRQEDVDRLERLIAAVWKKIMTFDLPDVSLYEKNLRGIQQFEEDLLTELI